MKGITFAFPRAASSKLASTFFTFWLSRFCAYFRKFPYLVFFHRSVDLKNRKGNFFLFLKAVDPHNRPLTPVNLLLVLKGSFFNLALNYSCLDSCNHSSCPINFFDQCRDFTLNPISQILNIIGTGKGINSVADTGFMGNDLLCT